MLCGICIFHIQPRKHALDHSEHAVSTGQHDRVGSGRVTLTRPDATSPARFDPARDQPWIVCFRGGQVNVFCYLAASMTSFDGTLSPMTDIRLDEQPA